MSRARRRTVSGEVCGARDRRCSAQWPKSDVRAPGTHPKSGLPLFNEHRIFFLDGEPIFTCRYWDEVTYREEAVESFRAALRLQPNLAAAHINLGDLLAQDGKDAEAAEHLEEAIRLAPNDDRALKLLREVRTRLPMKKE